MFAVSMPNAVTSFAAVETATKCRATAARSPSVFNVHSRADSAFASVSSVVNVFDATMNSVSSGDRSRVASLKSVPSTFDTKRKRELAIAVVAQRLVGHHRSQIAAADADVHDVADRLPGKPEPFARAQLVGELRHMIKHLVDRFARFGHLGRRQGLASRRAQRRVQHGALLGDVDLVSAEHRVDALAQSAVLRQRHQQAQRLIGDAVLGVVQIQSRRFRAHALAAPRIFREEIAKMPFLNLLVVRFQRLVRRTIGQHHVTSSIC